MIRNFNYTDIAIKDIENNKHLIFVCDGDKVGVLIDNENKKEEEK